MSFKSLASFIAVVALSVCWAAPARAQGVKLRFHDGMVTLAAQNAPLRAILNEWARLGGATIVNGERVAGPPVSLELTAVPERQALEILLRNVSGYMLAPRSAANPGSSVFDRIMILPTSSAPRPVPPAGPSAPVFARPRPAMPVPPPAIEPEPEPVPEDDAQVEEVEEEPEFDPADDDVPVVNPLVRPGRAMPPRPFEVAEPEEDVQDDSPVTQPGNPFGIPPGTTARPGVITPAPRQPQQRAPVTDPDP